MLEDNTLQKAFKMLLKLGFVTSLRVLKDVAMPERGSERGKLGTGVCLLSTGKTGLDLLGLVFGCEKVNWY